MARQTHSKTPERQRQRADGSVQVLSQRDLHAGPHANVMELQRVSGNRAVSQLLQPQESSNYVSTYASKTGADETGEPLDALTRSMMEAKFEHDFSLVRVFTNQEIGNSARAFTVGSNIVFGRRQYQPETLAGRQLLAHELTHVVQQGMNNGTLPGISHEKEAEAAADHAWNSSTVSVQTASNTGSPQFANDIRTPVRAQPRTVFIDTNVIIAIEEGNFLIEPKINELRRQGHKLFLSQQVHNELLPQSLAGTKLLERQKLIERLQLEIGPPGAMVDRVDVYWANIVDQEGNVRQTQVKKDETIVKGVLSEPDPMKEQKKGRRNDVLVAAQVKAADGELWTFDSDYLVKRDKAPVGAKPEVTDPISQGGLGVKIAPESWETTQTGGTNPSGGGSGGSAPPEGGTPSKGGTGLVGPDSQTGSASATKALSAATASSETQASSVTVEPTPKPKAALKPKVPETKPSKGLPIATVEPAIEPEGTARTARTRVIREPAGDTSRDAPSSFATIKNAAASSAIQLGGTLLNQWIEKNVREAVAKMPKLPPNLIDTHELLKKDMFSVLDLLNSDLAKFRELAQRDRSFIDNLLTLSKIISSTTNQTVNKEPIRETLWTLVPQMNELNRKKSDIARALELEPEFKERIDAATSLKNICDNIFVKTFSASFTPLGPVELENIATQLSGYIHKHRLALSTLHDIQQELEVTVSLYEDLIATLESQLEKK